ncbi:hypothetical protein [Acidovorax delafieldii]|uniref:hypothetical protein n=1 Tax=Acidovorax delafieldii TaxID=47920 RepID=UPI003ECEB3D5
MPAFSQKPHFVSGARYPLSSDAQLTPPQECDFNVGDTVTFTNDYGVSFPGKLITGFASTIEYGRFIYLDSDSWWFPVKPESLTLTHKAPAAV